MLSLDENQLQNNVSINMLLNIMHFIVITFNTFILMLSKFLHDTANLKLFFCSALWCHIHNLIYFK